MDIKSTVLQTGRAQRGACVIPTCKSKCKNKLWLFIAEAYDLVNSNTRSQVQFDVVMLFIGFVTSFVITQLYVKHDDSGAVVPIILKVVNDLLFASYNYELCPFMKTFGKNITRGTISNGFGLRRF